MLVKELQHEIINWKKDNTEAIKNEAAIRALRNRTSWNRHGISLLVEEALHEFEWTSGENLEYNFTSYAPYIPFPKSPYNRQYGNWDVFKETVRFCGWIKAAARMKSIIRFIQKTQSGRGMNSPYTIANLWVVAKNNPSPQRFVRRIMKVRSRANGILRPYGLRVSWNGLAHVLSGKERSVGKAAKKAAAITLKLVVQSIAYKNGTSFDKLSPFNNQNGTLITCRGLKALLNLNSKAKIAWVLDKVNSGEFGCFRDALLVVDERLVPDKTDGVELLLDVKEEQNIHGISIQTGWDVEGKKQYLLKSNNRTFHVYSNNCYRDVKDAIKMAVRAWKKQRELERQNKDILKVLIPEDRSFLIFMCDSRTAGNCVPGTNSWMQTHGFGGRSFVPAQWLVPFISEPRVKNVLRAAADRISQLNEKIAA
ncbi:MAG: hypothetical protein WCV41_04280 [Patescibacteria group bacterium]